MYLVLKFFYYYFLVASPFLAVFWYAQLVKAQGKNLEKKKHAHIRAKIESCYPDTRAKLLTNGKWFLTKKSTGEALHDIEWPVV